MKDGLELIALLILAMLWGAVLPSIGLLYLFGWLA